MKVDFEYDFNRILFVNSYDCNMNCPYCMHKNRRYDPNMPPGVQLGVEKSKDLFDTFIESSPYEKLHITFSGGEPLIYFETYMKPFILYIREKEKSFKKEIIIDIFTNGTLLTKEMFNFFKKYKVRVGVSYDGHLGQQYRDSKTIKKVEEKIKEGVKIIPNLISVASTFYKDSLPYIYDAFLTMANLGVTNWSFALDTLSVDHSRYEIDDYKIFGEQIQKIWKSLPMYSIKVSTFKKVNNLKDYILGNKAIIARPDGEINIGTAFPVLIPDEYSHLFYLGKWQIEKDRLQ